ncbi:hypothetical protein HWV62_38218 [Athelia sp. TMB]|nr:hypothetical protein HWV62_38218 [Athelia sp. TMB]
MANLSVIGDCCNITECLLGDSYIFPDSLAQLDVLFAEHCGQFLGILRMADSLTEDEQFIVLDTLRVRTQQAVIPRIAPWWYLSSDVRRNAPGLSGSPGKYKATHPTCTWIMRYIMLEVRMRTEIAIHPSPVDTCQWKTIPGVVRLQDYLPAAIPSLDMRVLFDNLMTLSVIHSLEEEYETPVKINILSNMGVQPFIYEAPSLVPTKQNQFSQRVIQLRVQVGAHAESSRMSHDALLEAHGHDMQWGVLSD